MASTAFPASFPFAKSSSVANLFVQQRDNLGHVKKLLLKYKSKTASNGHFAWWIWPTAKEGFSEPPPASAIGKPEQAIYVRWLVDNNAQILQDWTDSLKILNEALEDKALFPAYTSVIPDIDHGRIPYFIDQWVRDADVKEVAPAFRVEIERLFHLSMKEKVFQRNQIMLNIEKYLNTYCEE